MVQLSEATAKDHVENLYQGRDHHSQVRNNFSPIFYHCNPLYATKTADFHMFYNFYKNNLKCNDNIIVFLSLQ